MKDRTIILTTDLNCGAEEILFRQNGKWWVMHEYSSEESWWSDDHVSRILSSGTTGSDKVEILFKPDNFFDDLSAGTILKGTDGDCILVAVKQDYDSWSVSGYDYWLTDGHLSSLADNWKKIS